MSVIYLSGPISLDGTLEPAAVSRNLERFDTAAARLRDQGHTVLSPAELPKQEGGWPTYMRLCIPMVCEADLVYVLPGWGLSRGSVFEVLVAQTIGCPVEELPC